MNIKKITSIEELMNYRDDWDNILQRNQNNNPFIEFEWIRQWLLCFHESYDILIYAVWHEQEIIAFFPFIKKKRLFNNFIYFVGFGQANYMDIVVQKEWEVQAIQLVMGELLRLKRSVFILHGLLDSTGTADAIKRYCTDHRISFHGSQTVAPYIDLSMDNFNDYIEKRMKRHGGDRKEKRLKKLGHVDFRSVDKEQLEAMFHLHEKRWHAKMDTSGFTKGQTHEFYKSLSTLKNEVIETKLDGLYIEEQLVAFFYGFVCRDRYVLYVLAHDDDFGVFSPGRILLKEAIKDRYSNQVQNFDLSIGYESYKLDWNTGMDQSNKVMMPGKGMLSRLIFWYIVFKDTLIHNMKMNRRLVHFKRNTLGRLKSYLYGMDATSLKRIGKAIKGFLFQNYVYEIYQMDREMFEKQSKSGNFQMLTVKELYEYPSVFQENMDQIVKRLFKKEQGYCLIHNGQLANYYWVNEAEVRIDHVDFANPISENSLFVYDWAEFDVNAIAELFKKNKKLNSIYVAASSKSKDKKLFDDQGFSKVHRIMKQTFFGFSFFKKRDFQIN
ncbi:GNAT family N-acetyltransferase [Paenibacillus glycanilyticus]|uniref:BioF2-like acetyltransferase domain-containing protein n=1 Tax=Paenibacillus glycanilyticus TaxID=126569 RepID=A0ABQ6G8L5_9BACL|nr:GNAT family N-acetyltransferase [Paenibacillus glycanilyticus]GLX66355.1 hypothetical protein MU1_06990 [Paenibacillus glycanilyticus]